jgi:hypothetical protein
MHDQRLLGQYSFRVSSAWLAASSQSLPHPGRRVFHRSRVCYQRTVLDIDRASSCLRRGVALCSDLERLAIQHLGHYRSSIRWFVGPAGWSKFCLNPRPPKAFGALAPAASFRGSLCFAFGRKIWHKIFFSSKANFKYSRSCSRSLAELLRF